MLFLSPICVTRTCSIRDVIKWNCTTWNKCMLTCAHTNTQAQLNTENAVYTQEIYFFLISTVVLKKPLSVSLITPAHDLNILSDNIIYTTVIP